MCDTVHVFLMYTFFNCICTRAFSVVRFLYVSGVRVCWYKGACEGVCIRDYLVLYIIILYNMCSSSVGVCMCVRVFVCVGCSCVLVYGCV